ncbi:hypothetical protein BHJ80_18325 [Escherichia coli]|nr:hypothetical protein BHJ80_18325 [Escherichia coli]
MPAMQKISPIAKPLKTIYFNHGGGAIPPAAHGNLIQLHPGTPAERTAVYAATRAGSAPVPH